MINENGIGKYWEEKEEGCFVEYMIALTVVACVALVVLLIIKSY